MKGILRIHVPLFGGEEVAHVRDGFGFGLGDKILDGLHDAVRVSDGKAGAAPGLAVKRETLPAVFRGSVFGDFDRGLRFDGEGLDGLRILQK